ncbi:hypothetical protein JHN63_01045 [Streptomyces sp. MBT65]|uniref:hypothetical protein n=1 Tax=Streptomyces sp. MBT65 TaxID=1488395 RepID=UPI00190BCA35|nr:hypothetical protein [Streptomyces sp. MBT65]MBK3572431.1 hypothetical protein [Streptomyces sp. MBT65]
MGTAKWSTAFGAAGLVLVAVTTSAAAQGQPPHARQAGRAVLTNADNGRTVPASSGGDVEIRLTHSRERGFTYTWTAPESGNSAVLAHAADATYPSGDATAVFHAASAGVATVSAQRRCVPDPGSLCPLIVETWKVTIEVK